jgi:CRISPR-associated endonuclease/helicase Cas3
MANRQPTTSSGAVRPLATHRRLVSVERPSQPIAHTSNEHGARHDLVAHLRGVASLAATFASALGAERLGWYVGVWHDVGKFHPSFQEYLLRCEVDPSTRRHGPDHKAAGALLAHQHVRPASLLVQGHHGGLQSPGHLRSWLHGRSVDPAVQEALALARASIPDLEPSGQLPLPAHVVTDPHAAELFLRLVFSALVDADYLDTEAHFRGGQADLRGATVGLAELWERFESDQTHLEARVRLSGRQDDPVVRARNQIYQACLEAADRPPGLFRLTAPTGGGKTRAAMAFALRHALRHGHRRVIVAVPFISITEQTADVYRNIFETDGDVPVVLEHHSGAGTDDPDDDSFRQSEVWSRLAAENWDAPIVVTTTVQLFESLFSARPGRCRKLHRLAHSVIIVDEAQALPSHLLAPILDALRELTAHYGATVVLSTATQPAFEAVASFRNLPATEIVDEPAQHFQSLSRVAYEWQLDRPMSWVEVADLLRSEPQVLAVVNTKTDATSLLDALSDPDALHLSTLLCGAHRRRVLAEVSRRLGAGEPCRLVSTQVLEAGVDLDFPVVLRAFGPLDAVIQAAGRCNREGRLSRGRVVVFQPANGRLPAGVYRTGTDVARVVVGQTGRDLYDPAVSLEYFRLLFETVDTDREQIQVQRAALNYLETARRFRMIEDDTESLVVTSYGSGDERRRVRVLLDRLRRGGPDGRDTLRRLQPYVVAVRKEQAARHRRQGLIAEVMPGVGEWLGGYDDVRGLSVGDPEQFVI